MTREQQISMYGCSEEMLRALYEGKDYAGNPMDLSALPGGRVDPAVVAVSLLSDVQELIEVVAEGMVGHGLGREQDRLELARRLINRAKFGIMEYLRSGTRRASTNPGR